MNKGRWICLNLKYKSFYWCLGTTSFRTKNFNKRIEQQLLFLRNFWNLEENIGKNWNEVSGIQTAYYNYLHSVGFISGEAANKSKDAREKTSGLVALGLIDDNRRLTEVGEKLLKLSEQNNFSVDNLLGRVYKLIQPKKHTVEIDKTQESVVQFVVTSGYSATILQAMKKAFNLVA